MNTTLGIKLKIGGTGSVTPHPDDKSEAAEAIRATLVTSESTPPTATPKDE